MRSTSAGYLAGKQMADGAWQADPFVTAWAVRALATLQAAPAITPTRAQLSGRVVDVQTNLPPADADVALSGAATASTKTRADGSFSFTALTPGACTFDLSLANYQSVSGQLTLQPGAAVDLGRIALGNPSSTDYSVSH